MTMRAITLYTPYERQHGVIVDSVFVVKSHGDLVLDDRGVS